MRKPFQSTRYGFPQVPRECEAVRVGLRGSEAPPSGQRVTGGERGSLQQRGSLGPVSCALECKSLLE